MWFEGEFNHVQVRAAQYISASTSQCAPITGPAMSSKANELKEKVLIFHD